MPYGTVNADIIQSSVSGVSLGAGNASIMKNRIINGAMVIDQRNAGASVTPTADPAYTIDRWAVGLSQASKFSVQQTSTAPAGFVNSLKFTSLAATSLGAGDYFTFQQSIEGFNIADLGWGTANAKTVTLSAWVYSSLTGTFGGSLINGSVNRSYPFTYTIGSANTWTQISVTIAGDTAGTWATNNTTGIIVMFGLGVGTSGSGTAGAWAGTLYRSATGATSVVGTNGATFYITGVQLEVGSSATGFEYRQYTTELQLCQRYYIMQAKSQYDIGNAWYYSGSQASISFSLPVTMRTVPAVSYASGAYYTIYRNSATNVINDFLIDQPTTNFVTLYNATQASGTAGQSGLIRITNSAGFVAMTAEL